jgi:AraC-like DNA-binding protein
MCFVFAPGMAPHGTQDAQRRLVVFGMHFDVPPGQPAGELAAWLPPPGHLVRDPAYFGLLAHQCDVAFRRGDALGAEQCRLYLQLMILHVAAEAQSSAATAVDRALDELAHAIQREPGRRWSVADMAGTVHLSPAQLTRRFRMATGMPPTRFVIQARIERARQLLHETDMPISQIASALGYDDLFFFSRQYKRYAGRPPSEERRNAGR